jgi:hypothetical protein
VCCWLLLLLVQLACLLRCHWTGYQHVSQHSSGCTCLLLPAAAAGSLVAGIGSRWLVARGGAARGAGGCATAIRHGTAPRSRRSASREPLAAYLYHFGPCEPCRMLARA